MKKFRNKTFDENSCCKSYTHIGISHSVNTIKHSFRTKRQIFDNLGFQFGVSSPFDILNFVKINCSHEKVFGGNILFEMSRFQS